MAAAAAIAVSMEEGIPLKAIDSILTSTAVPLPIENVDTDQIIPARFLKLVQISGFGKFLFY